MPIYALGELEPRIDADAYVHPDATVIGDVRIGPFASVWPRAVLRGDYGRIEIGARTSVQDGAVIHCTEHTPSIIGRECVVGHNVHIEGATIADHCLIGSGSVVLNGAVVEEGAILGAGGVISFNGRGLFGASPAPCHQRARVEVADAGDGLNKPRRIPARCMALGVPARVREGYVVPDGAWQAIVEKYVDNIAVFRSTLRRLD